MFLLTKEASNGEPIFIGLFPDFTGAEKEMKKSISIVKKYNANVAKKFKDKTNASYIIHQVTPTQINTVRDCQGVYTKFYYNHKDNKIRKVYRTEVMHRFMAICPLHKSGERGDLLDNIAKECGGEVTGSGSNFVDYDFSISIPLRNKDFFIKKMKEAKFRCKYQGKDTPYD